MIPPSSSPAAFADSLGALRVAGRVGARKVVEGSQRASESHRGVIQNRPTLAPVAAPSVAVLNVVMVLKRLIERMTWPQRLALTDRWLPRKLEPTQAAAAAEFRSKRADLSQFALIGNGGALAACLAAASWEGSGRATSRALAQASYGFVLAAAFAIVAIGLGLWAAYCRTQLVFRREVDQEPPYDNDEAMRRHFEEEAHQDYAHIWVPDAVRWFLVDRGASVSLALSALLFVGTCGAAVRLLIHALG